MSRLNRVRSSISAGAVCLRLWILPLLAFHCAAIAAEPASEPASFRVMTYNIHHGEGLDKKVDLERIAALIKRERADLVALQEVDRGTQRTSKRNFPSEFAELTGMTCVFSNNYHFQGGEYGNAILSRYPVKQATNRLYKMLNEGEQRGLLQVVLDARGRELVFMSTHIDFRKADEERLANTVEIRQAAASYNRKPVILCGDFNATPDSRTYAALSEAFQDTWKLAGSGDGFTIPATKPTKRIDYIWLSKGSSLKPQNIQVVTSEASDHLPVVAEFRWLPE